MDLKKFRFKPGLKLLTEKSKEQRKRGSLLFRNLMMEHFCLTQGKLTT